jgi:uncharacterized glyoxalase superfamily protein PhnB
VSEQAPRLTTVYLFVRDMEASIAFYQRLGLTFDAAGGDFVRARMPDGSLGLEMGTERLTRAYDPGFTTPNGPGTNTLNFDLASRDAVDTMYKDLTDAGYGAHLAPIDAFWGSRFAIVDDPDGNVIGLHSPRDDAMTSRPPL